MASPKNRTTLYRFVSLRSPELSKKENQEKRFVFHPDNKTGAFFDAIKTKPANVSKAEILQKTTNNFPAFLQESDIEKLDAKFFEISNWLSQNLNAEVKLIHERLKFIKALDLKIELILWDNLFYQVITQKTFYVKESLMNTLLLQNTLKQGSNLKDKEFLEILPTLLKAKVVLPTYLFEIENSSEKQNATKKVSELEKTLVLGNAILDAQSIQTSKIIVQNKQALISELLVFEKKYFTNYTLAYENA